MIKNLLLIIFGIISLIAILNWLHMAGPLTIPCGERQGSDCDRPECKDSLRYANYTEMPGGGTAIPDSVADTLAAHFKARYLDSVHVENSYFSKKAIDHLFANHPTANAMGCTYGLENDSLIMIINVYRITQTAIDIPDYLDSTYIKARTYCPPTCPPPAPK